ncbi:hypothetical protein K435DRAFT_863431 [Dendrothele bispora CBS 962.96]|uniref:Uncharacterized protein n=1 Tax=Dendrothele bispora (strain CBS 962.96) TaxID=1314807 RepID=A0A4S8LQ11_DENBC|nr:hypothetical protein K435DRAFT_863431 [Dendrothele bispora CBS 962.96]
MLRRRHPGGRLLKRFWRAEFTVFCICILIIITLILIIVFTADFTGPTKRQDVLEAADNNRDGIILFGHVLNVDSKQRTLSLNWEATGCGSFFNRSEAPWSVSSEYTCGRVGIPVNVYILGRDQPVWSYDPLEVPMLNGQPQYDINLFQFNVQDADISTFSFGINIIGTSHVQHVPQEFLHPFGYWESAQTYLALSPTSGPGNVSFSDNTTTFQAVPILGMTVLDATNSFVPAISVHPPVPNIQFLLPNGTQTDGAYMLTTTIKYSLLAIVFVLMIFIVNWILTLLVLGITIGVVYRQRHGGGREDPSVLLFPITVIFSIPQLRALFVGDPEFGILLDAVGILLQIIVVSLCGFVLLFVLLWQRDKERKMAASKSESPEGLEDLVECV